MLSAAPSQTAPLQILLSVFVVQQAAHHLLDSFAISPKTNASPPPTPLGLLPVPSPTALLQIPIPAPVAPTSATHPPPPACTVSPLPPPVAAQQDGTETTTHVICALLVATTIRPLKPVANHALPVPTPMIQASLQILNAKVAQLAPFPLKRVSHTCLNVQTVPPAPIPMQKRLFVQFVQSEHMQISKVLLPRAPLVQSGATSSMRPPHHHSTATSTNVFSVSKVHNPHIERQAAAFVLPVKRKTKTTTLLQSVRTAQKENIFWMMLHQPLSIPIQPRNAFLASKEKN